MSHGLGCDWSPLDRLMEPDRQKKPEDDLLVADGPKNRTQMQGATLVGEKLFSWPREYTVKVGGEYHYLDPHERPEKDEWNQDCK